MSQWLPRSEHGGRLPDRRHTLKADINFVRKIMEGWDKAWDEAYDLLERGRNGEALEHIRKDLQDDKCPNRSRAQLHLLAAQCHNSWEEKWNEVSVSISNSDERCLTPCVDR
jgi:hypothetical protein